MRHRCKRCNTYKHFHLWCLPYKQLLAFACKENISFWAGATAQYYTKQVGHMMATVSTQAMGPGLAAALQTAWAGSQLQLHCKDAHTVMFVPQQRRICDFRRSHFLPNAPAVPLTTKYQPPSSCQVSAYLHDMTKRADLVSDGSGQVLGCPHSQGGNGPPG